MAVWRRMRTYQLHIELSGPTTITIGRLGTFTLPAGRYIYTGSAKRNIEARVRRHLSKSKKVRWHIDYLLTDPRTSISTVALYEEPECRLNQKT